MFVSLFRIGKFAAQNFWRNIWLSVITVSILVLTVLSFNVFVVMNALARSAVRSVEDRIDVSVYFKPGVSQDLVRSVRSYLLSFPQVRGVELVDPESALAQFSERHKSDTDIIDALREAGGNPLGAALVVRTAEAADYELVMQALEQPAYREYIEEKNFDDHKLLIAKIISISQKVQNFGLAVSAVFALIAVLIVFNSIRVAIYTHRDEIGIMKLVGASSVFVRSPFLLEGVLYSFLAMTVAMFLALPLIRLIDPAIVSFFDGANVSLAGYFRESFLTIVGGEFGTLAVLTVASSAFAMRKYLRV